MVEYWELKQRVRKFCTFDSRELKNIFAAILVLTFIWGFNDGHETFEVVRWTAHLFGVLIMSTIAVFTQIFVQKVFAVYHGYKMEFRAWPVGLVLGVIVTFITRGNFPLMLVGGPTVMHLSRLRVGEFRYGLNTLQTAVSAFFGPLANIVVAMFLKAVIWQIMGIQWAWLDEFFIFSMAFAVYSMLPIPPLSGILVYYGLKLLYIFGFAAMLGYILLIVIFGYYSLIWAFIIGVVVWGSYNLFFEKG